MNQLILAIFLSVRGYLPFIRKDSTTHMHRPAVYVKEGLCFAQPQDLSLENSVDFNFVFDWRYFTLCLTSFSSITYPLCRYACFFYSISSNIDEVLSMSQPGNNVFVFGDSSIHHKNGIGYI